MLILNESDIIKAVDFNELLKSVEEAFLIQETGNFNMPDRSHIDHEGNVLLLMPCFGDDYFSTKLVSVFPKNKKLGKPAIYGSVVLNDGQTGEPLAIINGSKLTALRTGAVGALGLLYTTPKNIKSLGLIGAGIQGFHQVLFACGVREIEKVFIYDPYHPEIENFIQELKKYLPDTEFTNCLSSKQVLENSEALITATTSLTPVLPDSTSLYAEKHIIGIGSFKPEMQELPDGLFKNLDQIFVDTNHAKKESGDLSIRIKKGLIQENQIYTLGQLINKKVKIDEDKTTLFKSVGMALFDLIVARTIYLNAIEKGIGTEVKF
jgi:ornithine cyclodeaminase